MKRLVDPSSALFWTIVRLFSLFLLSSCAPAPEPPAPSVTPQRLPSTWTPQPELAASETPTPGVTQITSSVLTSTPHSDPTTLPPESKTVTLVPLPLLEEGSELRLTHIQMIDANHGWAVGTGTSETDAHILRTLDGGLTWHDVSPPELVSLEDETLHRANGYFLDPETAWVAYTAVHQSGNNMIAPDWIWRTQDGGLTWQPSSLWQSTAVGTTCWNSLTFDDNQWGWLLVDCWQAMGSYVSELYRTLDGGKTWKLAQRNGLTHHTGMRFFDREGWVSRNSHFWDGLFLDVSQDGGLNWQEQQLPFPDESLDPTQFLNCGVFSLGLFAPQTGALHVRCPAYRPVGVAYLYRTQDGGSNWEISTLPGREVFFLDLETGWALSAPTETDGGGDDNRSTLFQTQNGGQSWNPLIRVDWNGPLQFLDHLDGWALVQAEDETTLMRTSDGGLTWEALTPPTLGSALTTERPIPPRIDLPAGLAPITRANLDQIQILQTLPVEGGTNLSASSRGDQFALSHNDGRLSLWDLAGGQYPEEISLHRDWVYDLAYHPAGNSLASASKDGSARLVYRFGDCRAGPAFTDHQGEVTAAALYGGILATGSQDGTIALSDWGVDCDASSTLLRKRLEGHTGWVWDAEFSPDGTLLASSSSDRTVRLWDLASEEAVTALAGRFDRVWDISWSPDGLRLVTISEGDVGGLWDAGSGQVISELGEVLSVSWAPDGARVALFDDGESVRIWNAATGTQHATLRHPEFVTRAAWSPDVKWLATGSLDGVIRLWDVASGGLLLELKGHTDWVSRLVWSQDGSMLATGAADDTVLLWDGNMGAPLDRFELRENLLHLAWSPDNSRLATVHGNGSVGLWDLAAGQQKALIEEQGRFFRSVTWSPDGKSFAGLDVYGTLMMWDGADAKTLASLDEVSSYVWDLEGRLQAAALSGGRVELWDVAGGERLAEIELTDRFTREALLSPGGQHLATLSDDGVARVWLSATGREVATAQDVESIQWSPDGKSLALFAEERPVSIVKAASGETTAVLEHADWARGVIWPPDSLALEGHTATVWRVAFSPDGQILASASWDGTVRLWDVVVGRELRALDGHSDWVLSVSFSPDGSLLATGSADGRVILWDPDTGEVLKTLDLGAPVHALAFTPDGRLLLSLSGDSQIHLWGVGS